ncbi:MAG: hypothetical protein AAB338_01690 [Patescibacteria group bacterium]
MTAGELIKETASYLIIKNPITGKYSEKEKIYIPTINSKHTFFFIPKGMIKKATLSR